MMSFDGWDARYCGDAMALPGDVLAHWRTKGSKNGVRRYQQTDGTWTPLGLRMRKQREGWGDGDEARAAARSEKKAARSAAKAERQAKKQAAATARKAERVNREKKKVENLTDAELQARIRRIKMENEYKELTKSPALKIGEKVVEQYMAGKARKAERLALKAAQAREDQLFKQEMERMKKQAEMDEKKYEAQKVQSEATKAQSEATKAQAEVDKAKSETAQLELNKSSRKYFKRELRNAKNKTLENKKNLLGAKKAYKDVTIRGGVSKMVNKILTGKGEAWAKRIVGDAESGTDKTSYMAKLMQSLQNDKADSGNQNQGKRKKKNKG